MTKYEIFTHAMALSDADKADLLKALIDASGRNTMAQPIALSEKTDVESKRTYDAPTDVYLEIEPITVKGKKAFRLGYGGGRGGAKMLIKSVGFAWSADYADDKHKGAWVGTSEQYKKLTVKDVVFNEGKKDEHKGKALLVSAEWVQKGRDKAEAKANKRNK